MSEKRCDAHWFSMASKYGYAVGADLKSFTAGFLSGIAEKVHMGACQASMASPKNADAEWVRPIVADIAVEYGLVTAEVERINRTEFWFFRHPTVRDALLQRPNDNFFRASICGLDVALFDRDYVLEAPEASDGAAI